MTKPQKLGRQEPDDRLKAEIQRLVSEAEASGFEPHEGMATIKADARKRLKQS